MFPLLMIAESWRLLPPGLLPAVTTILSTWPIQMCERCDTGFVVTPRMPRVIEGSVLDGLVARTACLRLQRPL